MDGNCTSSPDMPDLPTTIAALQSVAEAAASVDKTARSTNLPSANAGECDICASLKAENARMREALTKARHSQKGWARCADNILAGKPARAALSAPDVTRLDRQE